MTKKQPFDLGYYIYQTIKENGIEKAVAPLKIGLKITNRCHFRYPHCFVKKQEDDMAMSVVHALFNKLSQLPYEIYLTGGEPTLYPSFSELVILIAQKGIRVSCHTTGVMPLSSERFMIKHLEQFSRIQVSLDSIKDYDRLRPNPIDQAPFDRMCDFIQAIVSRDVNKLSVNVVVSRLNLEELPEIIQFCHDLGVKNMRLSPIFSTSSALLLADDQCIEQYRQMMLLGEQLGMSFASDPVCHPWSYALKSGDMTFSAPLYCPAQKTEFEVDMFGDVYPCPFLHDPQHLMGNILSDEFETIWHSGVSALDQLVWSQDAKCQSCVLLDACGGGCYALAAKTKQNYDKRCSLHD